MIEEGQAPSGGPELTSSPQASAGGMLRAARQAAGVHIEALAVSLKVPVSKLEALEADNFEAMPDAVFARALASSVCRSLKLDPVPVLALMPQSNAPKLSVDHAGINATFKDGTEQSRVGPALARLMRPAFLAAMVLLVGAAALVFYPQSQEQGLPVASDLSTAAPLAVAPAMPESSAAAPVTAAVVAAVEAGLTRPSAAVDSMAPIAPAPVPSASVAIAAVDVAQNPVLLFRALGESWVQVRDASGITIFQKLLTAGESVAAPGKPPFSVVVGKADATEVLVRGKVLDLASVSKDNVARFEVKP